MLLCSLLPDNYVLVLLPLLLYLFRPYNASITNEQDEPKSNFKQLLSVQQLYQPSSSNQEARNFVDDILNGGGGSGIRRQNRLLSTSTVLKCDVKTKPCFNGGVCSGGNCVCPPHFTGRFCELCGGRVNQIGESGYITDGLSNFTKKVKCLWILEDNTTSNSTNIFHYLTFRFDRFSTECCADFLQVFDGDSAFSTKLMALRFSTCNEDCSKFHSGFCDSKTRKCTCKSFIIDNETTTHPCATPSCKKFCKHGQCSPENFCHCEDSYTGQFCNISITNGRLWTEIKPDSTTSKAGHDVVLLDDSLFVIGGENFDIAQNLTVSEYNFLTNTWTKYNYTHFDGHVPKNRYGHTVVAVNDAIYIIGGSFSPLNVTNECWRLDIVYEKVKNVTVFDSNLNNFLSAENSSNITEKEKINQKIVSKLRFTLLHEHTSGQSSGTKVPLNVFGHTCHVVGKSMLIFGGYNPFRGFMNLVQEHTFANDSWTIIETSGAKIPGFAGHTSVLDPTNNNVYIFGGYGSQPRQTLKVYDHLLLYQYSRKKWLWLQESGLPTYFHSASLLNNLIIVVGGNTRNNHLSVKENCFQEVVQIFDLGCSDWHYMDIKEKQSRVFGHKAIVYKKRIHIFGGFDGRFSNRMQKFTPVDCSSLSTEEDCKFNSPALGTKCGFYKGQCQSIFESDLFSKSKFSPDSVQASLLDKSRKENVDVMITPHVETEEESTSTSTTCKKKTPVDKNYCDRFYDCESCASSLVKSCNWCHDTQKCSSNACESFSQSFSYANSDFCPLTQANCSQFHSCIACKFYDYCFWKPQIKQPEASTCIDITQIDKTNDFATAFLMTKDQMSSLLCFRPCQLLTSCESCTKAHCSWCATTKRCLDNNSRAFFYPYGQCSSWAKNTQECPDLQDCQYHLTCAKCQAAGPRCGWCDDGSQTGLGRCMEGGYSGPLINSEERKASNACPANRWHFTSCPACQCNGHSTCIPFPKRTSADPLIAADDSSPASNLRKHNESLWRQAQQRSTSLKKNRRADVEIEDDESSFKATTNKMENYHRYDDAESSSTSHPLMGGRVFKALLMSKTSSYSKTPPPSKMGNSSLMCKQCAHKTTGEQCERCQDGFYGNALNGGNCTACECNNHAQLCHPLTGRCYCSTKGIVGHRCDRCDSKYIGNPLNSTCYYEVFVDYSFAFNLNNEDDVFVDRINFISKPSRPDIDVTFKITCSVWSDDAIGRIDLNITSKMISNDFYHASATSYDFDLARGFPPRRLMKGEQCTGSTIQKIYSTDQFHFGTEINTTFYVTVYGFRSPLSIQISFAQSQNIDWMRFFVTFALCFFFLLVVAFILWKIKQKIDLYRRRQRLFVEMAQMASRPFGVMTLDWSHTKPCKKQYPTAVAVEPCENFRAAVVTVALKMPTGGRPYPPTGQPGLALASALCYMTPAQVLQLQTSPSPQMEEKTPKRRRPTCIS